MPQKTPLHRPRFVVDAMLGNVARELRLLGFDALYAGGRPDSAVLRLCQSSHRTLVTRDRNLAARARGVRCVFVADVNPGSQTLQVLRDLGLGYLDLHPFTRCIRCNGCLRVLSDREARERVPDHIAHGRGPYRACDACGRTYWPGSHAQRLGQRVRSLVQALQAKTGTV